MIRTKLLALTVVLIGPFVFAGFAAAQSSTPAAAACTVTPRTDAELAILAATPAAAATPEATATFPAGDPIDSATFSAIQSTLDQLQACQKSGNVNAVLALYTDAYVSNVALAPESVPIVEGTPAPSNAIPAATPETAGGAPLALISGHRQADGSVAGLVLFGSNLHVFFFVQQGDAWRIDRAAFFAPVANGAPAAPVQQAIAEAAKKLGLGADSIKLVYVEKRDWPDSSLGCPEPGKFYAQVITPGYLTLIAGSGKIFEYHTDATGHVTLCRTFGE